MDRTSAPDAKTVVLTVSSASFKSIAQLITEQKSEAAAYWATHKAAVSIYFAPQSGILQYKLGDEDWVDAFELDSSTNAACEVALECSLSKLKLKATSGTISVNVMIFVK